MEQRKLRQLIDNIKKEKSLESFPLCYLKERNGKNEFYIISGHHRYRAARAAGLIYLYAIVIEKELTKDEVLSKQLSHNSLQGFDNEQILKEMYESIETIEEKLRSGIFDDELKLEFKDIKINEVDFEIEHKIVNLLFMKSNYEKYIDTLKYIQDDETHVIIGIEEFERFMEIMETVRKTENIKNVTAAFTKIIDIVMEYYNEKE